MRIPYRHDAGINLVAVKHDGARVAIHLKRIERGR